MALITIDEFKDMPLGLKESILEKMGDPGIQSFIDTASQQVENYCGRQLSSGTVVESFDGNGDVRALLSEYPATALTSVTWEDEAGLTGTETVSQLRLKTWGLLQWKDGLSVFEEGRYYTVTYTAGYAVIPGPIKQAVALWVTELMQPTFNQGAQGKPTALVELSSEQIGELLEEYRRKGVR